MAHIILRPHPDNGPGTIQLIINGVDYSMETYRDLKLVEVGEGACAEVGFQVTFAVSRLDLGDEANVQITDRLAEVAEQVAAIKVRSE